VNGRAIVIAAALIAVSACAACAASGRSPQRGPLVGGVGPVHETRDELLVATGDAVWRGDLTTAHVALTRLADREAGRPDTALDFWSELLALLRCEPLAAIPAAQAIRKPLRDPWDHLRRLVQIERLRLSRGTKAAGAAPAPARTPLGEREGGIFWPVEREHWSDELPMPAVASQCGDQPVQVAGLTSAAASEREVALVTNAATTLPASHPATPVLLVQAAVLDVARGDAAAAAAPLARLERLAPDAIAPAERARMLLASGVAALSWPHLTAEELQARGRAALALPLAPETRRSLSLLLAERLIARGKQDEAVAMLGPPPHGQDPVGRFIAFRQAEAHARAGRRGELLAEAREVLNRRSRRDVEEDPALAAVMDLALRTLLASPVSAETLEVLESLGPPRERLQRAEAFAQIALEAQAFKSAMATFLWLHENDKDGSRPLQHLARASVAAARAGDRAEFARTFRLLAGQEESAELDVDDSVRNAIALNAKADADRPRADKLPKDGALIATAERDRARGKRRAARSVNWQRALLVVARDALPALVDNDDQANLGTLVDTLKRHLGDAGRGPVDEELTTLYRAASAHLKTGARAYAETVGSDRRPILLGDVLIGRKYDVRMPRIDVGSALEEVGPVVFVPDRGNDPTPGRLRRWPRPLGVAIGAVGSVGSVGSPGGGS
jgi:hypothetical protein